ncbi:MAG: energy-coupled thiamine transporter ThiT [Nitrososphaeria archaeon]|nr:energy-coupled thiamine transporter ThiT [Nitrososphaeria archaeon]NIQ33402.1 energy-coupled thiamine transporter ThiT [Nitrososphaeria archaeon]
MTRNALEETKLFSTKIIAEASVIIALSTVLSFIRIFHMPQGGSVTAGSMVPLLWISLRRGLRVGLFTCTIYGLVQFMAGPYVFHPAQVLLDYPVAFGALGLAGLFRNHHLIGSGVGIGGRFISHFLSGFIFFASYAPEGMNPIIYSALYNGSYLAGELVVSLILIYIIVKKGLIQIYL